jgi:hypothetical protein
VQFFGRRGFHLHVIGLNQHGIDVALQHERNTTPAREGTPDMLDMLNDYLQIGAQASADPSGWPLMVATALIAVTILRRQSDD